MIGVESVGPLKCHGRRQVECVGGIEQIVPFVIGLSAGCNQLDSRVGFGFGHGVGATGGCGMCRPTRIDVPGD